MRLNRAVCYLCLDEEVDEAGQPLRRDCACRGTDAGFVHLSCLAGYAETKSKQARDDMNEFVQPWLDCLSCHQNYQNELRIDIATEFVSFIRRQYPDDTQRQVEALYLKMAAFDSMLNRLQPVQKREAGVTANVLLSLIDRMKGDAPLQKRYSQFEAHTYHVHGNIALIEGTEESARRAVTHFEIQLRLFEAIGNDEGIATAKANIVFAKSKYEGGWNDEEFLRASQELYELCLAELGEEHEYTICAGKDYAVDLVKSNIALAKSNYEIDRNNHELLKASQELYKLRVAELGEEHEYTIDMGKLYAVELDKADRGDEARDLLTKLLATSKQILGPDHNITKSIDAALK